MKLWAIIVPLAFTVLPTLAFVAHTIILALQGKEIGKITFPTRPIKPRTRRLLNALVFAYSAAYMASILWAFYVFTEQTLLPAVAAFLMVIIAFLVIMFRRSLPAPPKPPPEGFRSEVEYREYENRVADWKVKGMLKYFRIAGLTLLSFFVAVIIFMAVLYFISR